MARDGDQADPNNDSTGKVKDAVADVKDKVQDTFTETESGPCRVHARVRGQGDSRRWLARSVRVRRLSLA